MSFGTSIFLGILDDIIYPRAEVAIFCVRIELKKMPELPEVEKATGIINRVAAGKRIKHVETFEDTIVFSGIVHEEFAKEIIGRTIKSAGRYGKCFYLDLDGKGRKPVLHFGMTGMLQVKGDLATYYKVTPKTASTNWPPRFVKFILHLVDDTAPDGTAQLAFLDARRLGRIRLCSSPLDEPPISELGFDPILSMPPLADFVPLVLKRSCPIKALLLNQSFSAGVGNWVADEILYNSRIHPEQRCNTLTTEQLTILHHQTADVCRVAVSVNADDTKFPAHWLFKHRWGKGKKEKHSLKLPSGQPATIKWITVGGRTSAYVPELQTLSSVTDSSKQNKPQKTQELDEANKDLHSVPSNKTPIQDGSESDLTAMSDSSIKSEGVISVTPKRKARPTKFDNIRVIQMTASSSSSPRKRVKRTR